jgi:hypothetical protein
MVATPISTTPTPAILQEHYGYFLERAFHFDHIQQLQEWGVRSISLSEALKMGIKKFDPDTQQHLSDGGIWFPYTEDYGQLRFSQALTLSNGEKFKYLGPRKPAQAWLPPGAKGWSDVAAITEGWADAAAPTVRGVNTAAIVGTYNIIHSVPMGCRVPIIFDSDGWAKPAVMRALLLGSIWTKGRINLFPAMPEYPNGGGCEFFKSGRSASDYKGLIDEAMTPYQILHKWIEFWPKLPVKTQTHAVSVAMECAQWLRKPDAVLTYLEQQRDKKNPDVGISAHHEESHLEFLAAAIEE